MQPFSSVEEVDVLYMRNLEEMLALPNTEQSVYTAMKCTLLNRPTINTHEFAAASGKDKIRILAQAPVFMPVDTNLVSVAQAIAEVHQVNVGYTYQCVDSEPMRYMVFTGPTPQMVNIAASVYMHTEMLIWLGVGRFQLEYEDFDSLSEDERAQTLMSAMNGFCQRVIRDCKLS